MHCRMFSIILDLYQLYTSSIPPSPPSFDNQNHLQILPDVPWGGKIALGEKHWIKGSLRGHWDTSIIEVGFDILLWHTLILISLYSWNLEVTIHNLYSGIYSRI